MCSMMGFPRPFVSGTVMCCGCFLALVLFAAPALANTNSWTKPTSCYWEEQAYWSLGVLPDLSQSVLFNNPGWKALAIGTNAARNFPDSLHIQELRVASPVDSHNVLFINFAGFEQPLQTTSVLIGSNSAVVMQGSALEVISTSADGTTGNLVVGGAFQQGDHSQVKVGRRLDIGRVNRGAYFLTNGTLSAESEAVGLFAELALFVQYGGVHTVGALSVNTEGYIICTTVN